MIEPWNAFSCTLVLAATLVVLSAVIQFRDAQMDTDEAVHARDGQEYAHALRGFEPSRVGSLLSRPQWHPPAHGVALGTWFVAFGSSVLSARAYSVVCYLLLGITIWASAFELCRTRRGSLAFVAVLLFALDSKHAAAGGTAMLEAPSGLLAMLALLLFVYAYRREGREAWLLHGASSCVAVLCFLTRYSHGLALLAALGAAHGLALLQAWSAGRLRSSWVGPAIFLVAVVAVCGTWLWGLGQLKWLLAYSDAQPRRVARWSLANFTFYPASIARETPFGPFVMFGFAVCLLLATVKRRLRLEHAVYLLYLGAGFALLFLVRQKAQRFGLLLLPPLWVLTVALVDLLLPARAVPPRGWTRSLAVALGLAVVGYLAYYKSPFPRVYENADDGLARTYGRIGEVIEPWRRERTSMLLLGRDDLRSGAALAFSLVAECDRRGVRCEVQVVDDSELKSGWPRRRVSRDTERARLRAALQKADFVVRYDQPKEELEGRRLLLDDTFSFRRKMQLPLQTMGVTVYGPLS